MKTFNPTYNCPPVCPTNRGQALSCQERLVRRSAFICKYCNGVYADEPVSQCDCLGYIDQKPPHFIKGKIEYRLPNDKSTHAEENGK